MRRILLLILTVILIVFAYFVVANGISIGNFKILSWNELMNNNQHLDDSIGELERIVTVSFPDAQDKLNNSYKQLKIRKEEYADLVLYSSEEEIAKANQTEIYETEFLWTKLGNYATKNNGTEMKIDVVRGSSNEPNVYNLNFTMTGDYVHISDFISAVENDARLGFRINKFLLVPSNKTVTSTDSGGTETSTTNLLQATFTVENVGINIKNNTTTNVNTRNNESTENSVSTNNSRENESSTQNSTNTNN